MLLCFYAENLNLTPKIGFLYATEPWLSWTCFVDQIGLCLLYAGIRGMHQYTQRKFLFYAYECFATMCVQCLQRPEKGIRALRTGVTVDCKSPCVLEISLQKIERTTSALKHWVLIPTPRTHFIFSLLRFTLILSQGYRAGDSWGRIHLWRDWRRSVPNSVL